jgi:hypothetical protein
MATSGALPGAPAVAGAALGAGIAPVAGIGTIAARARARGTAVTWVGTDPGAPRRAGRGGAADQPTVTGMQRTRGAAATDVVAIESGQASCWETGGDESGGDGGHSAQRAAPRLPRCQQTGHRVEPLSIHGRVPYGRGHSIAIAMGMQYPAKAGLCSLIHSIPQHTQPFRIEYFADDFRRRPRRGVGGMPP